MQTLDKYLELYKTNGKLIGKDDPPFVNELRKRAIAIFEANGFR